jgi:hypothetical protein
LLPAVRGPAFLSAAEEAPDDALQLALSGDAVA